MRRPIRDVRDWSHDPRSIALIAVAAVYLRVTLLYQPWSEGTRGLVLPSPLVESGAVPLWIYGLLWALSGLSVLYVGLAQVAVRHGIRWLLATSVVMPVLWTTFYAIGFVTEGFNEVLFASFLLYASLTVIVASVIEIPPARLYRSTRQ